MLILFVFCLGAMSFAQDNSTITIEIQNIESNEGSIYVDLFNEEGKFLESAFKHQKASITDKSCTVSFKGVPAGQYAIAVYHDENNNGELDSNFFGAPDEPIGMSNNPSGGFGPPKWKDAVFSVNNKQINLSIKIQK